MTQRTSIKAAIWPEHQQTLRQIRSQVFVEEQQVPVELEWDGLDEGSYHWLAYQNEQPIGCCRMLKDGHIGRMAVLKTHRSEGVGAALLAAAVEKARSKGLYDCYLSAQTQAAEFYQKAGFTAVGEQYLDAGMPHISMRLTLSPLRLLGQHGGDFAVNDVAQTTLELVQQARKQLCILSYNLDHRIFDTEPMADALSQLARSSRYSEIKILVVDTSDIIQHGHRLLTLHRRLPSNLLMRRCTAQLHDIKHQLIIADQLGLINQSITEAEKVWANFNNRPVAENYSSIFDGFWQHAVIDNNLRQLSL